MADQQRHAPPLARFGDLRQTLTQPVIGREVVLSMLFRSVAAALVLSAGPVAAQETSFLLKNSTGYPISELSVSMTQFNMWGPNFLKPPPIAASQSREVSYKAPTDYCMGDLKVGFADGGKPAIWQYLNLCTLQRISLHYDRMSGITTARYDE
jgi:hypothetical protein